MGTTSSHIQQQLGSPLRKADGLLYSSNGVALGKGFNAVPMEPPQNGGGNNASVNLNVGRGQNNAGAMASSCRRQNGGSNGHHDIPGDIMGPGARDVARGVYQNGVAMYSDGITGNDLTSVLHYGQSPMLNFRSSLPEHYAGNFQLAFQQMMGYSLHKEQDQALLAGTGLGSEYSAVCGISTSAGVFYPSSVIFPEDIAPMLNGSNVSDMQFLDHSQNFEPVGGVAEETKPPETTERTNGHVCTFEEPEHRHEGYFSTSWPFVPNPWYRPGMPNDHMQMQMRVIESPRAKGPVTRPAFMFKPERKGQQDPGSYHPPSKKLSPGKRTSAVPIMRPHPAAVQLTMPQSS